MVKGQEDRAYNKPENILSTLSTDTTCQLDVFGHDGDTLGVDGAQVGVLKQTHQVGLTGLLQRTNHCCLGGKDETNIVSVH